MWAARTISMITATVNTKLPTHPTTGAAKLDSTVVIHCPFFFVLIQAIDGKSFFDLARRSMLVFSENSGMPVYAVTSLGNWVVKR